MKILVLDGFALNPGDLSWKGIKELGTLVVYDRTEQARIISRIGDADVVVVNKCPISRETIEACPNLKLICEGNSTFLILKDKVVRYLVIFP